jgi:thioredoxin 1
MYTILAEIADERPDMLIGKVNVDDEPELAKSYGIVSIPTLVAIKDGKVAKRISGYQSKEDILEWL